MRILSQDGTIDVPYEQVVIQRFEQEIYFLNKNLTGNERVIGDIMLVTYSDESKAKGAMEMLRVAYENYDWIKTTGNSEEIKSVARCVTNEQFKKLTAPYFQFPADEELEG